MSISRKYTIFGITETIAGFSKLTEISKSVLKTRIARNQNNQQKLERSLLKGCSEDFKKSINEIQSKSTTQQIDETISSPPENTENKEILSDSTAINELSHIFHYKTGKASNKHLKKGDSSFDFKFIKNLHLIKRFDGAFEVFDEKGKQLVSRPIFVAYLDSKEIIINDIEKKNSRQLGNAVLNYLKKDELKQSDK